MLEERKSVGISVALLLLLAHALLVAAAQNVTDTSQSQADEKKTVSEAGSTESASAAAAASSQTAPRQDVTSAAGVSLKTSNESKIEAQDSSLAVRSSNNHAPSAPSEQAPQPAPPGGGGGGGGGQEASAPRQSPIVDGGVVVGENFENATRTHRKAHKSGRRGRARTRIIRVKMTRRPRVTSTVFPEDVTESATRGRHSRPHGYEHRGYTRAPFRSRPTTEEQKLFIVNPQNGVAARPDLASPDIKSSFQGYNSAKDMISMTQDSAPRKWTSLTITSGSPPFVKGFEKLPRTEKDAVAKGWLPIDDYDCDGEYTNLGRPYMLSEDPAIILLFDKSGYIAGLQTALSETEVWESRDQGNSFKIEDSGYFMQIPINGELHFALTALFVEPEIICSTGRTPDEFDEEGTGTGLYIVVAGIAVKMEMRETDLDKNVWMSGNFFPGMGNHYFAQIDRIGSEDHPVCDDWVPFFLLYNRGYLNAFGWTFFGRYKSSRFEYQSTISYPVFMDPIPQCVEEITSAVGMTTFHILFETFYRNLGFK